MLKRIAKNKYKVMAIIICLYLLADVLQHKGQARVLFPKQFSESKIHQLQSQSKNKLINANKNWKKGVNTIERLNALDAETAGFECDVYFDTAAKIFDVHHDPGKSTGLSLEKLIEQYQQKKLTAGIWLDIKNLDESNSATALGFLIQLQQKYNLQNKILVESDRSNLLSAFSDNGFFTSYYVPFFNPYKISRSELQKWVDSTSTAISNAKVDALSGYYFQSSFLNHYFPRYPFLTWVDHSSCSLVNFLFQKKIAANNSIFIVLKP
jgi:heptose-I-phosphate ethanolaminephosphotransferase